MIFILVALLFVSPILGQYNECTGKADGPLHVACKSYSMCIDEVATSFSCGDDQVYDKDIEACNNRSKVISPCAELPDCSGKDGKYHSESDCRYFYTCSNGYFQGMHQCSTNLIPSLVFDEDLQACNWYYQTYQPCGILTKPTIAPSDGQTGYPHGYSAAPQDEQTGYPHGFSDAPQDAQTSYQHGYSDAPQVDVSVPEYQTAYPIDGQTGYQHGYSDAPQVDVSVPEYQTAYPIDGQTGYQHVYSDAPQDAQTSYQHVYSDAPQVDVSVPEYQTADPIDGQTGYQHGFSDAPQVEENLPEYQTAAPFDAQTSYQHGYSDAPQDEWK